MKKVKFKNGKFSIRKFSIWMPGFEYRDLKSVQTLWWGRNSKYYTNCQGTEEDVDRILERMTDKGEVVK